jgi:phosphoribosyl 1,2-cyclic phosphodiesterase
MGVRFTVLASGSAGNATILQSDGFGLLIDAGLGPRHIASRLGVIGATWRQVHAVILTHTHSDHWKDRTLAHLATLKVPLYCHADHREILTHYGPSFRRLADMNLVRPFERGEECKVAPHLRCLPVEVPHDSEPTFAFRIQGAPDLFGPSWSVGYASDVGCETPAMIDAFRDVDLLALEFNHDEAMERRSRRPRFLVERVLGDRGHLSNRQAGEVVKAVVGASDGRMLRHVVQLHLSRDCNLPSLAAAAGRDALKHHDLPAAVVTATQDEPTRTIELDPTSRRTSRRITA